MNSIKKRVSFRDWMWGYPDLLIKYYDATRPLGAILVSTLIAILTFTQLSRPWLINSLAKDKENVWSEGVVGSVQILNPIYVNQNQVDRDIYELIYERFIEIDHDGNPLPGIAESWEISEDGTLYTFTLAKDRVWHDGIPLLAEDVKFTFDKAIGISKLTGLNTIGISLTDVVITTPDPYTVQFTLPDRSATFFESVSTYIIPKHILENIEDSEWQLYGLSQLPIGSGPFRMVSLTQKLLIFEPAKSTKYRPKLERLNYYLFDDINSVEIAFRNGALDGISGIESRNLGFIREYQQYKVYGAQIEHRKRVIFLNLKDTLLSSIEVRKALATGTDKESILNNALIDGKSTYGPLPSNSWALNEEVDYYQYNLEEVDKLLTSAGYSKRSEDGLYVNGNGETINLTLTYLDTSANKVLADELIKSWRTSGFNVSPKPIDFNRLVNEILATRNFQLMLFEIETTLDPDQYNLWHSTKKNYPDLNISGYEYNRVDIILARARINPVKEERLEDYLLFQRYMMQDSPVIFLYEPSYIYTVNTKLKNLQISDINFPQDRFSNIDQWEF